jgi:DNA-binding Xre family transcriptional regulator
VTEEDFARAVSAQVRRLLDERGISGNQLAKASGVPQTSIAGKLRGASAFTLNDLDSICSTLGVKVSDLIEWAQRG